MSKPGAGDSADRQTIEKYFSAMRRGAEAESDLMALFAENATYVEPFSGDNQPAIGHEQIRARLRIGWEHPLPDLELDVLTVEVVGSLARSTWECRSPAFPSPVRGSDSYEFNARGTIQRLEVRLDNE